MLNPACLLTAVLTVHVAAQIPPQPEPPVVPSGNSARPATEPQGKAKKPQHPSVTFHVIGMKKTASGAT